MVLVVVVGAGQCMRVRVGFELVVELLRGFGHGCWCYLLRYGVVKQNEIGGARLGVFVVYDSNGGALGTRSQDKQSVVDGSVLLFLWTK